MQAETKYEALETLEDLQVFLRDSGSRLSAQWDPGVTADPLGDAAESGWLVVVSKDAARLGAAKNRDFAAATRQAVMEAMALLKRLEEEEGSG